MQHASRHAACKQACSMQVGMQHASRHAACMASVTAPALWGYGGPTLAKRRRWLSLTTAASACWPACAGQPQPRRRATATCSSASGPPRLSAPTRIVKSLKNWVIGSKKITFVVLAAGPLNIVLNFGVAKLYLL
ncbi:hypothetical protein ACJJTC_004760 [Scirpophaga incertulas]